MGNFIFTASLALSLSSITKPLRQNSAQENPNPTMENRLFTTPRSINAAPTSHSQRNNNFHGNVEVVKSHNNAQCGTAMSGSRNAVVESHTWSVYSHFVAI